MTRVARKSKTEPKPSKEEVFRRVVRSAIELDLRCGHLKWTIARLARSSEISRPLIYYYFGKSKTGILVEAAKVFGGELAGFTDQKSDFWAKGKIDLALADSRKLLEDIPGLAQWYFLHRGAKGDVGSAIRGIEQAHVAKIRRHLPGIAAPDAVAVFALFFGVSFSPIADGETPARAFRIVARGLGIGR